MKITLEAELSDGRLVFTDERWKELDLQVCVHGEKLRWTCDDCDEAVRSRKAKAL